ncbi:hypothetical protein B0H10DRAFT_2036612 [Mycena sp. CBHHK59/15]|nr:hypothetical protein B0H10DRAFT_2233392 [Mycena sp. CBHHK59/15]KAJ6616688.1 hypothetical protein B0H10DRAFT_2036612 [Mycena sp. CBHHK59/15]
MSSLPRKDRVRIMAFLKKRDGLANDEFAARWLDYAEIFRELEIVKANILRYEQTYANDRFLEKFRAAGMKTAEFDAVAVLESESYEKIFEVMASEEYAQKLAHLQTAFLDPDSLQWLPVDVVPIIDK